MPWRALPGDPSHAPRPSREQVVSLIDDTRSSMYSTRMRDIFEHDGTEGPLSRLLRSPAEKAAATKAAEKAALEAADLQSEMEAELDLQGEMEAELIADGAEDGVEEDGVGAAAD